MITAEIGEVGIDGKNIDYVDYNHLLEEKIRKPFEDANYEIQIIGFAKQIGDIADGARSVLVFCAIALLLTALAVYWYCHSMQVHDSADRLFADVAGLAVRHTAPARLRTRSARRAGAVPGLRDRRVARRAADQLHHSRTRPGQVHLRRGAAQLHRPADPGHPGAGHRVRLVRHAAADPDSDGPRTRDHRLARRRLQDRDQPGDAAGRGIVLQFRCAATPRRAMAQREQRARWLRSLARVAEPRNAASCRCVGRLHLRDGGAGKPRSGRRHAAAGRPELRPEAASIAMLSPSRTTTTSGWIGCRWFSRPRATPATIPRSASTDDQLRPCCSRSPAWSRSVPFGHDAHVQSGLQRKQPRR